MLFAVYMQTKPMQTYKMSYQKQSIIPKIKCHSERSEESHCLIKPGDSSELKRLRMTYLLFYI